VHDVREQSDRVLLLMEPGYVRELVSDWLDSVAGYETETATSPSTLSTQYDICLVDADCIDCYGEHLRQRRREADSYLPHILFRTEPRETDACTSETTVADELIDEVVALPVEEDILARRVENLLATRRASVQFAERERLYRELVELIPESILLVEDDRIVCANAAAAELLEVNKSGLLNESLERYIPPEEHDALRTLLESVPSVGTGATEFAELCLQTATGRTVEVTIAGVAAHYDGDEVVQLFVRDLTETKRHEQRRRLFSRAVEAAGHGIVVVDAGVDDQPIVYANAEFTRMTGYSLGEVLGRNCRLLQGENTADEPVRRLREAVDAGEHVSVEMLNYRKDGTPFWNEVEIVPIRDTDGTLTHFVGLQQDITDQVRNEQRLAVFNRILRHNVRNKTNVIRGYADAIVQGEADAEASAERIRTAADELFTISEQIREFDTVLRTNAGATETIDLATVVEDSVAALRRESLRTDVTYRMLGAVTVAAHPTLQAAIQDLLYQLGEVEAPEAEIVVIHDGENVRLDIIDRGGAVSHGDLELVSSRSETPLDHLQGLELWLLRWTVEQSGGEFSVDQGEYPQIRMRFPPADVECESLRDS